MKNISNAFKRALMDDDREYLAYADITLPEYILTEDTAIVDGKIYYTRTTVSGKYVYTAVVSPTSSQLANYYEKLVLHFTNSELWAGGFSYEESVSDDDNFTAIGSAIIGSAKIIIDNIDGEYTQYNFFSAEKVVLSLGMELEEGDTTRLEKFQIGVYTVDDASYTGGRVSLSLLDNMAQFDRSYSLSTLLYPNTLENIVNEACSKCGVTLGTLNFPHKTTQITVRPNDESTTFRDVISYCATIAGCFTKCNPQGQLEFGWFNTDYLDNNTDGLDGGIFDPWETADVADGGSFNPWSTGTVVDGGLFSDDDRPVHFLSKLYSQNIAIDDVLITGVVAYVKDESETATSDIVTKYSGVISGPDAYVIEISDNPFITTNNAQTIVDWLGDQLIGVKFRKLSITQSSDPSIETGDIALVLDRFNHTYATLITRVGFAVDDVQTIVCGASTPSRNNATQYSSQTKSYVENRKLLKKEQTLREQIEQEIYEAIENSDGLYSSQIVDQQTGKTTYYLHNLPDLNESAVRMMFSDAGITVTSDNGQHWYGLTVSGTMLLNLLSTTGLSADWINVGTLSGIQINLGNSSNIDGTLVVGLPSVGNSIVIDENGFTTRDTNGSVNSIMVQIVGNGVVIGGGTAELTAEGDSGTIEVGGNIQWQDLPSNQFYTNYVKGGGVGLVYETYSSGYYGVGVNRNGVWVAGDFVVGWGSKNRAVDTDIDGKVLLYSYETATPYFGDIGFSKTDENGEAIISLDDIFSETVNATVEYAVFLQKEGPGDIWVDKKDFSYFSVKGDPNIPFSWEIKVSQSGYENSRLDNYDLKYVLSEDEDDLEELLDKELEESDNEFDNLFIEI